MKSPIIAVIIFLMISSYSQAGETYSDIKIEYQLQNGDLISELLFKLNVAPKWGKTGYIQKTFEANPELFKEQGFLWKAGEVITLVLPFREEGYPEIDQTLKAPITKRTTSAVQETTTPLQEVKPEPPLAKPILVDEPEPTQKNKEATSKNLFRAKSRTGFTNLKVKDSSGRSAEVNSSQGFGLDLNWTWFFKENKNLDISYSLDLYDFESNSNLRLNQEQSYYHKLKIGSSASLSKYMNIKFGLGIKQKDFSTNLSDQSIDITAEWAPEVYLRINHLLYKYKKWKINGELGLALLPSKNYSNFESRTGSEQKMSLSVSHNSSDKSFFGAGLYLYNSDQDSNSLDQSQISYGLQFFMSSELGGGDE